MKIIGYLLGIILWSILAIFALIYLVVMVLSYLLKDNKQAKYFQQVAEGLDQSMNGILGGNIDHTISGRMGYRIKTGKATKFEIWLCKVLSKIDQTTDTHCLSAIEWDEVRD